jgi:UBX domain-containing protein 1
VKKTTPSDVFDAAKKYSSFYFDLHRLGAQAPTSEAPKPFKGSGHRLGETSISTNPQEDNTPKKVSIIFWKNGFTVGDGPLRDNNDPMNASFLQSIKKGYTACLFDIYQSSSARISFVLKC